jgi:hypothetical protein
MKIFQSGRFLRTSSLPLRATLTGFLLFMLVGYGSNLAILAWKTGFTPSGVAAYYLGDDSGLRFPKEMHELLENTHFHVYIVPMVLLVLTHVFFMTGWSERARLRVTVLAYAAAALDLAAPWIVWSGGAAFAPLKIASSLLYHGTLFFLVLACLYETWWAPLPSAAVGPADAERG